MQISQRIDQQTQESHLRNDPPHEEHREDPSEHELSNELRELGEEENKSALITDNPQKTLENASRVDKDSANNTMLAHSELIQMPVQHLVQQQAPLRLSTPVATNRPPNFIQTGNTGNIQQVQVLPTTVYNQGLRATLPATAHNQAINQGLAQHFSGWISQPVTTQARLQTNVIEFPNSQVQQAQGQARIPVYMQQNPNQIRPNSSSPQGVVFHYQANQKNVPLQQHQQAQILVPSQPPQQPPKTVPQQPPQQVVVVHPQQNIVQHPQQVVLQPKNPVQPYPPAPIRQIDHSNSAVFILPQQQPNQQAILWQQRYFIILQKFQYYYTRIEIIHKKCVYLDQAIIQTKKPEQLQLLKAESEELLQLITSTEQELTETIHRNRELLTQATNWKQKYEQLAKAFEALKQSQAATTQELIHRGEVLSRQLAELEANYSQIAKQNQEEVAKNHKLESEVQVLNSQLKELKEKPSVPANYQQFQVQCKEMTRIIEQKNVIILNLKRALEEKDRANNINISPTAAEVLQREIKRLEQELALKNVTINELQIHNADLQRQNLQLQSIYNAELNECRQAIEMYKQQVSDHEREITSHQETIKKLAFIIEAKTTEINTLSKQSVSSQGTPRNSQAEIQNRRLKHELTIYEESHASDIKILNGKIQELLDKVKMISNERDSTVGSLQEKATILQSDLNRKDGTIRNLRDRILELEEEKRIRDLDRKYEPKKPEDYSQSQQINHLRRELSDKINEIDELQAQLTEYKRITNQYEDSLRVKKHEINTLRRELEEKSDGVQSSSQLNEQLLKKNAELADLRNKLVQLEKINNQNEILRQENNNLNESLRKKHTELTEAADKSYFLEKKVRELEASTEKSPKLLHLSQEIELLESVNIKKDQEIAKLRQNAQLLQSNIDELEIQLQRVKNRLNAGERSLENQRGQLKGKLSALELKAVEYERKVAGLEEVRTIMAEQVNTLTTEVQIKYENQQRVELQLRQQRGKIKALQAEIQCQIIQTESARNKVRQWEKKYQNISKELEAQAQKKKDLSNTKKNELFNLNNKYLELESASKAKDNRIKELEKTVDSLNSKIRSFDHNIEQIEYLKHKISEYEHKISYQNHRFTTRLPDLEPTQVFERKVIYQLKVENEALRRQLGLAPKQEGKEANIPEKDTNNNHVNQRLADFHKKLEEVISENLVVDYTLTGDELYRRMERDRRLLIEKHNEEITQLKIKILQLQGRGQTLPKRYTNINQIFNEQLDFYREKNLQLEQRVESHIKVNRELKESIEILLKTQSGEASITYYKEQIEKANDTIVNLQKQIKKLNEQIRKLKEDASKAPSRHLIESNVVETQTKTAELTRKISQLTLQINLLEKDRINKDQIINRNESELKRLKVVIEQLKAAKEELQRNLKEKEHSYQDQLTKITNKLRINQQEIERLNGIVNSKQDQNSTDVKNLKNRIAQLQEQNKKLKTRVEELIISEEKYQREIAKHENKTQVLLGEIQRLKEIADGVGKKQRQGDIELQSLRVTINQYESKIKVFQSQRESLTYKETQLQQEIGRLVSQNKLLQSQIERMSEFTQKKVSQRDAELNRLKVLLNQKQDYSSRLQDQIREMKVLSFKSNETAQEIFALKEEINSLKVVYNLKITQSESRLKEIRELNDKLMFTEEQLLQAKRFYEAKINELQSIINNLQIQLNESRKIRDSSSLQTNNRVQSLQEQLRMIKSQKQQEIMVLKSRISVLEGQAQDLRSSYQRQLSELRGANFNLQEKISELTYLNSSLNEQFVKISREYQRISIEFHSKEDIISQLRLQISHLQQQLAALHSSRAQTSRSSSEFQSASRYTIEYLRSILIEIDTLVSQEGSVRYDIQQRVQKELQEGLQECRRWNEQLAL